MLKIKRNLVILSSTLILSNFMYLNAQDINTLNDNDKIEHLKSYPSDVSEIKNPSERMQRTMIDMSWTNIKYIENPSEDIQLYAIDKQLNALTYLKKPTERVQIRAYRKNPTWALENIKNPTEKVQLMAINEEESYIRYIKNPTEKVQITVVGRYPQLYRAIKNPTEKTMIKVLQKSYHTDPELFKSLNASVETRLKADVLYSSKKPSYKVKDKNIEIVSENNIVKVINKTQAFLEIKNLSEYSNGKIVTVSDLSLPPQAEKEVSFSSKAIKINSLKQKINYGFAAQYINPKNNKKVNLYKTKDFKVNDVI